MNFCHKFPFSFRQLRLIEDLQSECADVLPAVVVVVDRGEGPALHQGVGDLGRQVVGGGRHHVGQVAHPAVVARRWRTLADNVAEEDKV